MYVQVPQPPEVLPSALTSTSANLTWSSTLEKNYTITSYSVNVTVANPGSINVNCLQGQNIIYYFTVPGYQRYIILNDTILGKSHNLYSTILTCISYSLMFSQCPTHPNCSVYWQTQQREKEFIPFSAPLPPSKLLLLTLRILPSMFSATAVY